MRRAGRRETALNLATMAVLLLAVGLMARDRLLPAWRDRQLIDPGDRVPEVLRFVRLADGDTLGLAAGRGALLLVFRSTCPACGRAVPAWNRLAARGGADVLAVALEEPGPALAYTGRHLPRAVAVRPIDQPEFVRRFRLRAVPTTLLVDSSGRLRSRLVGELGTAREATLRDLLREGPDG